MKADSRWFRKSRYVDQVLTEGPWHVVKSLTSYGSLVTHYAHCGVDDYSSRHLVQVQLLPADTRPAEGRLCTICRRAVGLPK